MQINLNYVPSPTALKFHTDKSFIRGVIAQPGSGKSVMMIQELLWIGYNQAPDQFGVRNSRFAIIRATYPALRTTTIKTYSQWVPPLIAPVKQTAPMTSFFKIKLPDGTSTNMEFIFIAVEDEQDTEKLKSLELTAAFINEASEVDRSVLDIVQQRVGRYPSPLEGGCSYSCVVFDSNPPSSKHWIAQLDENQPEGTKIFHQPPPFIEVMNSKGEVVEYKDNPEAENVEYLNQQPNPPDRKWTLEERKAFGYTYYRRQMAGKDKHWIDVNIMGRYGNTFDGLPVYGGKWSEDCVSKYSLEPYYGHPVIVGIDTTGLNPAAVFGQVRMGVLWVTHELLALDTPFETFVRDVFKPFIAQTFPESSVVCYTDPANPRDNNRGETPVQVLKRYGIMAQNASSNKFKVRRDTVISFLEKRDGLLIDKRCTFTVGGFRGGYAFRPLRVSGTSGQTHAEEPLKNEYSHIHDAFQYLCLGVRQGTAQPTNTHTRRAKSKRVY